ncbi:F0F1 ATP synthase subunit B [Rhodosalinus sp.]|uniref:F0F1 ATP synthase subunit B n=1 Tax=Rhodosalinus sp. TaxID=2047741 RepID=UPI0035689277
MRILTALTLALAMASPAHAAKGPFFSLANTDFIVLLGFLVFVGILVYFKVPGKITEMLDRRTESIQSELDEARGLREEAQSLLASYERKTREAREQADRIVEHAKEEARLSAEQSKADLQESIARRVKAAEERIAQAEAAAVREVRERAAEVAVAAARDVLTARMTAERSDALVDNAIAQVDKHLH